MGFGSELSERSQNQTERSRATHNDQLGRQRSAFWPGAVTSSGAATDVDYLRRFHEHIGSNQARRKKTRKTAR